METMEIILLIAGGLIFILSFFIPEGKKSAAGREVLSEDEINRLLAKELSAVRGRIDDMIREVAETVMEETERSLEKLSNEKIMAVSEYSDTVLSEIHRNHEEAVFLYDMLNNKHTSLKNALGEINQAVKAAEESRAALEKPAPGLDGVSPGKHEPEEMLSVNTAGEWFEGRKALWPDSSEGDRMIIQSVFGEERRQVAGESASSISDETEDMQRNTGENGNQNAKILELYSQGKSIVDIAKELNRGVGEVKLVVELYKGQPGHIS